MYIGNQLGNPIYDTESSIYGVRHIMSLLYVGAVIYGIPKIKLPLCVEIAIFKRTIIQEYFYIEVPLI